MNMIEKRKRNMGQGGFTLIELLVVIAILAILAGVAVFAVSNLTDGADKNACKLERDTIRTAIQAAKAKGGTATTTDYLDGNPKYFSGSGTSWTATSANTFGTDCPVP